MTSETLTGGVELSFVDFPRQILGWGELEFLLGRKRANFIQTLVGQAVGAYLGAKLTRLAPRPILKFFMVAMSASGGLVMLLLY